MVNLNIFKKTCKYLLGFVYFITFIIEYVDLSGTNIFSWQNKLYLARDTLKAFDDFKNKRQKCMK